MPGWVLPHGREPDEITAAFAAGIALKSLDDLVRSEPVWAGCWRARQALKCAVVAVRLMGRNENEPTLRDALLLTAAGDDPGPAGRVLLAYKRISARKPAFSSKAMGELADLWGCRTKKEQSSPLRALWAFPLKVVRDPANFLKSSGYHGNALVQP